MAVTIVAVVVVMVVVDLHRTYTRVSTGANDAAGRQGQGQCREGECDLLHT